MAKSSGREAKFFNTASADSSASGSAGPSQISGRSSLTPDAANRSRHRARKLSAPPQGIKRQPRRTARTAPLIHQAGSSAGAQTRPGGGPKPSSSRAASPAAPFRFSSRSARSASPKAASPVASVTCSGSLEASSFSAESSSGAFSGSTRNIS